MSIIIKSSFKKDISDYINAPKNFSYLFTGKYEIRIKFLISC